MQFVDAPLIIAVSDGTDGTDGINDTDQKHNKQKAFSVAMPEIQLIVHSVRGHERVIASFESH